MNEQQKIKLEESKWKKEREEKLSQLDQCLKEIISTNQYSFVTFDDSDKIQSLSEDWPSKKWEEHLYLQTETKEPGMVTKIISNFIEANPYDFSYVFFMNYNFGLVKISNDILFTKWPTLIEIDGDEIFCYMPDKNCWICIQRTEEFLPDKKRLGPIWIYEVTFSNMNFKNELLTNSA